MDHTPLGRVHVDWSRDPQARRPVGREKCGEDLCSRALSDVVLGMRALRMILIFVLMGGIVAPDGMALQVCLCELFAPSLDRDGNASSSDRRHECCEHAHGQDASPRQADQSKPLLASPDSACSCIVLLLPSHPQSDSRSSEHELPAFVAPRNVPPRRASVVSKTPLARFFVARIHGPPGARANLPLRI